MIDVRTKEFTGRFKYHAPNEAKALRHERLRQSAEDFAVEVAHEVPEGREQSLALTKIEEAMFWANAAIARSE